MFDSLGESPIMSKVWITSASDKDMIDSYAMEIYSLCMFQSFNSENVVELVDTPNPFSDKKEIWIIDKMSVLEVIKGSNPFISEVWRLSSLLTSER